MLYEVIADQGLEVDNMTVGVAYEGRNGGETESSSSGAVLGGIVGVLVVLVSAGTCAYKERQDSKHVERGDGGVRSETMPIDTISDEADAKEVDLIVGNTKSMELTPV